MRSFDDDDFLTARWTGRGTGPRRSGLSWRGRLGVGVLGFCVLVPVAAALRNDSTVTPMATSQAVTAVVPPLRSAPSASTVTSTTVTTVAPTTATAPPTTAVAPPTTAPPTTTTTPPCPQRFEVRQGDSWYGLADASGVTVRRLLAANGASLSTMLFPGRTVCLPADARRPPATTTTTTTTPPAPRRPTPTATTTTVPLPPRSSTDDVMRFIREVWPGELHTEALLIAQRESRLVSNVRNACCWGIFQIHFDVHRRWLATQGVTRPEQLLDAATNVRVAWALYQRAGGWGPWGW